MLHQLQLGGTLQHGMNKQTTDCCGLPLLPTVHMLCIIQYAPNTARLGIMLKNWEASCICCDVNK